MSQASQSKRILVVEDDAETSVLLRAVLHSYGYQVALSDDLSVLQVSREHLPDLIMLDLVPPTTQGLETIQQLRSLPETSSIPIVLMTASPVVVEAATRLGVVGYLRKPFDLDELLSVVRNALEAAV